MRPNDLLLDAFERVAELVPATVADLSVDDLLWRPDPHANSIGWLVWHLARVEDDHVAGLAGSSQLWTQSWRDRFDLPYPATAIGYGQSADEVGAFTVASPDLLTGYYGAVHERTVAVVSALSDDDFVRVVDENYDPPVTAAVRLVSVVNDITQHVGQAAYVRGLRERQRG